MREYQHDTQPAAKPLFDSNIRTLPLVSKGKVRDIYTAGDDHLLIVTTDRLSAFDVVLPDPIPGKGEVLTAVSDFWFQRTQALVRNHLADLSLEAVLPYPEERALVAARAVVVHRLKPLPVEAIVRGYLIGSGWKDYQRTGIVCGIKLPDGLELAQQLPEPLYTPSTKAEIGLHDENIDFATTAKLLGTARAEQVRDISLGLYRQAAAYALEKGIIIADTKFEFGVDAEDNLVLIDEALTPDSSRFWPADGYVVGTNPPSFDKQFVGDNLEDLGWDKKPPAPRLPPEIIAKTAAKYREARQRLVA